MHAFGYGKGVARASGMATRRATPRRAVDENVTDRPGRPSRPPKDPLYKQYPRAVRRARRVPPHPGHSLSSAYWLCYYPRGNCS